MNLIGQFVGLLLFGTSSCQLRIPKHEFGFVYNGGKADASVKVDAFLDLLCPDSKQTFGVIHKVADHYGPDLLQLRVHLFPLPYHRNAFMAAKGAFVMDKLTNGMRTFDWIHDVFKHRDSFTNDVTDGETGARVLSVLATLAQELGIEADDFKNLMTEDNQVELDTRCAWSYGCSRAIYNTPMVLINDILVNVEHPEDMSEDEWMSTIYPLLQI